MHVISTRRAAVGSRALAIVDVDAGGLRVFNVEICRGSDGRLRAWAPKIRGEQVAAFAPDIADKIGRVALAALEGGAKYAG
ncbi:hypothetical protein [Ancylobacter vacuolatus]|uniref:Phage baseplate assembly protein gpV n=1 Tax=Ancylobacter vacuolatus TaxID=223389 RepID=A0ABU0DJ81_9HYPH|nr:hypothetical protein [Ancylobacter vacuolatus]MDQ0348388.1 phage baseplate assembly protein gpV [Ancylobacter vacuolatus]